MLDDLKQLALTTLATTPALRREIVQLVSAIERCTSTPRTFPGRAERRASHRDAASSCKPRGERVE